MQQVCRVYGVLFILDEVMCGLGRTGEMHAYKKHNVVPDILLLGKGLAGGYANLSAMLVGEKIEKAFLQGSGAFNHGHTFQNHAGNCAVALAVMKLVQKNIKNVRTKAPKLGRGLRSQLGDHPNVGDIRGVGFFWTVSFHASD